MEQYSKNLEVFGGSQSSFSCHYFWANETRLIHTSEEGKSSLSTFLFPMDAKFTIFTVGILLLLVIIMGSFPWTLMSTHSKSQLKYSFVHYRHLMTQLEDENVEFHWQLSLGTYTMLGKWSGLSSFCLKPVTYKRPHSVHQY